jgi:hypothetical protein
MKPVTRRTALAALSAASFGSLVSDCQAAPPEAPAVKHELFVVGPFSLGNWFKKHREETKAKDSIVFGAPDDAEIVKSLNECKLYVIDRRVSKDKETKHFDDPKEGYPQLVASGKLIHTWKEKGKNCTIWVKTLMAIASSTDESTPPPSRIVELNVTIDIRGENAFATQTKTVAFNSDQSIAYDITGKRLPCKE